MKTQQDCSQTGGSKPKSSGLTAVANYVRIPEYIVAKHWLTAGLPPVSDAPLADTRVRDYIITHIDARRREFSLFKSDCQVALRAVPSLYLRIVTQAILTLYSPGPKDKNPVQYMLLLHGLLQNENTAMPEFSTYKNTFSQIVNGLPQKFVPRVEIEPLSSSWKSWQPKCSDFAKKLEQEHFHILEEREKEYTDLQIFCNTHMIPTLQQLSALLKQKAPKSHSPYNPRHAFFRVFFNDPPEVLTSDNSQLVETLEALIGTSEKESIRTFSDEAAIFIKAAHPQIVAEEKLIRAILREMRDIPTYSTIASALLFLDAAAKGIDFADVEHELRKDDSFLDPTTTALFSHIWDKITRLPTPKVHPKISIRHSLFWLQNRILDQIITTLDRFIR